MPWRVSLAPRAEKDLVDVPMADRKAIGRALERLAADPYSCDIKKLKAGEDVWRLRVGSWRVRFRFQKANATIEVLRVLPRSKGYGDL